MIASFTYPCLLPLNSSSSSPRRNISPEGLAALFEGDDIEPCLLEIVREAYGIPEDELQIPPGQFSSALALSKKRDLKATLASLWMGGRCHNLEDLLPSNCEDGDIRQLVHDSQNSGLTAAEHNKRLNAAVRLLWERFKPSSESLDCHIPGFTGGCASIYVENEMAEICEWPIGRKTGRLPFVPSSFSSRSLPFEAASNEFDFPDNNGDYGSAKVGYVSTKCSLAFLSLFSSMSAIQVRDGDSVIFMRRLVSQPKVNVRPVVCLTRIYDESASPNKSGLMSACLGLCGVDITQASMTSIAYSARVSSERSGSLCLAPTINVSEEDNRVFDHDCRVPSFITEDEVFRLGEILLTNFHSEIRPQYDLWVKDWEAASNSSRTTFHFLQLLSYILQESNEAYHGLRSLSDWLYLRMRLNLVASKFHPELQKIEISDRFDALQQQVRVLLAALSPVRLAWIDGCGRMTTVSYLLSMKFPHAEILPALKLSSDKFNLICEESTLLDQVGKVHNNIRILGFSSDSSDGKMPDSLFRQCRSFSTSLLTSLSHSQVIGICELVKIVMSELEDSQLVNSDILKWDFEKERNDLVCANLDETRKKLNKQIEFTLRHPYCYWNFHQQAIRKVIFRIFYEKALATPVLDRHVFTLISRFIGNDNSKFDDHAAKLIKVMVGEGTKGEKTKPKPIEKVVGQKMAEKIEDTKKGLCGIRDNKSRLFWSLEYLFWKTTSLISKTYATTDLSSFYALLSGCVYLDYYDTIVSFEGLHNPPVPVVINQPLRPLQILSKFAASNGGADDVLSPSPGAHSDFLGRIKRGLLHDKSPDKFMKLVDLFFMPCVDLLARVMHRSWAFGEGDKAERNEHAFGGRIRTTVANDFLETIYVFGSYNLYFSGLIKGDLANSASHYPNLFAWTNQPFHKLPAMKDKFKGDDVSWVNTQNMVLLIACLCFRTTSRKPWKDLVASALRDRQNLAWKGRVSSNWQENAESCNTFLFCSDRMLAQNTIGKGYIIDGHPLSGNVRRMPFVDPRGSIFPDRSHLNMSDFRIRFEFASEYLSPDYKTYLDKFPIKSRAHSGEGSQRDSRVCFSLIEIFWILSTNRLPVIECLREAPFNVCCFNGPVLTTDFFVKLNEYVSHLDRDFLIASLICSKGNLNVGWSTLKPKDAPRTEKVRIFAEVFGWCLPTRDKQATDGESDDDEDVALDVGTHDEDDDMLLEASSSDNMPPHADGDDVLESLGSERAGNADSAHVDDSGGVDVEMGDEDDDVVVSGGGSTSEDQQPGLHLEAEGIDGAGQEPRRGKRVANRRSSVTVGTTSKLLEVGSRIKKAARDHKLRATSKKEMESVIVLLKENPEALKDLAYHRAMKHAVGFFGWARLFAASNELQNDDSRSLALLRKIVRQSLGMKMKKSGKSLVHEWSKGLIHHFENNLAPSCNMSSREGEKGSASATPRRFNSKADVRLLRKNLSKKSSNALLSWAPGRSNDSSASSETDGKADEQDVCGLS